MFNLAVRKLTDVRNDGKKLKKRKQDPCKFIIADDWVLVRSTRIISTLGRKHYAA